MGTSTNPQNPLRKSLVITDHKDSLYCDCNLQYLVIDIFALWCPPSLQDVVVVTVVNDEDPTWSDHTGNVTKGQLLVTLVP